MTPPLDVFTWKDQTSTVLFFLTYIFHYLIYFGKNIYNLMKNCHNFALLKKSIWRGSQRCCQCTNFGMWPDTVCRSRRYVYFTLVTKLLIAQFNTNYCNFGTFLFIFLTKHFAGHFRGTFWHLQTAKCHTTKKLTQVVFGSKWQYRSSMHYKILWLIMYNFASYNMILKNKIGVKQGFLENENCWGK